MMKFHSFSMAALMVAAIAFISSCKTAQKEEDLAHQVGLQLYSIRGEVEKDLEGSLQKVGEMGYNTVEAANYDGDEGLFYGLRPRVFADLCAKYGLKFISSHINCPNACEVSEEECLAWWAKAIDAHALAGVSYIVQPAMPDAAYDSIAGLQKYCDIFNRVGQMCAEKGIKFGYHNHSGEFETVFDTPDGPVRLYDYMLTHTNPDYVFFQMDQYWIKMGGCDAVEYFEKYPGRFKCWHIKDKLEVGASGMIDFAALYKYADLAGMEYQIVEQEAFAEGLTPFESIKISLDNTRAARVASESAE